GKTEIAKVLAAITGTDLIRLQCYEGLDENKALYEWNYQKQLLKIQAAREANQGGMGEDHLFSDQYLLERPLLKAIRSQQQSVLLVDEIDKTDEEFEAFLFEVLSDFQVSVPELGTIKARHIPIVVLTSNGERELSDGLRRRCAYLYIDFPSTEKEIRILRTKLPHLGERLSGQLAQAMYYLRHEPDLKKKPSIAETLDWAKALLLMGADRLSNELIEQTLNLVLKNKEDMDLFREWGGADKLMALTK
ncbi:MAG TPA: MoxR family ATPase, partial [Bacillota bacterium]|nr:MoxR family ATPase [Bacillota bacterium]